MADSLRDRVVVVIGASSGIGRQTAILFAREGAKVMASARREARLRDLAMEMAAAGCADRDSSGGCDSGERTWMS